MKINRDLLIGIVILFVISAGIFFLVKKNSGPGKYDSFTQCLKDEGAKFYGAFWCSHCQNTKKQFGNSQKYLPYIECSSADGNSQLAVCSEKNIASYPTWEFADGSREMGELTFEKLAEKTSCQLPQ